jgi:hypothetical protein
MVGREEGGRRGEIFRFRLLPRLLRWGLRNGARSIGPDADAPSCGFGVSPGTLSPEQGSRRRVCRCVSRGSILSCSAFARAGGAYASFCGGRLRCVRGRVCPAEHIEGIVTGDTSAVVAVDTCSSTIDAAVVSSGQWSASPAKPTCVTAFTTMSKTPPSTPAPQPPAWLPPDATSQTTSQRRGRSRRAAVEVLRPAITC